jgi:hypothetical protein
MERGAVLALPSHQKGVSRMAKKKPARKKAGSKGGKATAKKYPKGASARGKITKVRRDAGFPKKRAAKKARKKK